VLCSSEQCNHCEPAPSSPICAALGGTEELVEDGIVEPVVAEADLPHCTKCGALARPGIVWFGEIPHHLETIDGLVDRADLCLVVGTSSTVSHQCGSLPWKVLTRRMTGVSRSFLHARSQETWWEGRDIQCGEEQWGRSCGFLVSWAVRGNHPGSFRRQSCLMQFKYTTITLDDDAVCSISRYQGPVLLSEGTLALGEDKYQLATYPHALGQLIMTSSM
jgi:Sir2 family